MSLDEAMFGLRHPEHPVVEVLDEGGRRTGIIGRAHTVRVIQGVESVEVACAGRRIVVPTSRVMRVDESLLPQLARI